MDLTDKIERFKIRGMRGPDCAAAIEKALADAPGVAEAHADFDAAVLTVRTEGKLSAEEIQSRVAAAGYRAVPEAAEMGPGDSALDREDPRANLLMIAACGACAVAVLLLQREGGPFARLAMLAVAAAAIVTAGAVFYRGAAMAERNHTANMDTLVAIGVSAACLYSIFTAFSRTFFAGAQLLGAAIGLILFIRFGKFLESRARRYAMSSLRAPLAEAPDRAAVVRDGAEVTVPASQLAEGDIVAVAAKSRIPVDGIVIEGAGAANESMLTGDSAPAEKREGSRVFCGTLNLSAPLKIRADAVGSDTAAARLVRMAEEAQAVRTPIQRKSDKAAARIVQTAIAVSALTAAAWLWLGGGRDLALGSAIAVLVTAAPGAIGQAGPAARTVGSALGLRWGMLFKRAAALETIAAAEVMVFAKSGVLTQGRPELETLVALEGSAGDALAMAAIASAGSDHPLSRAVRAGAREQGAAPIKVPSDLREEPGMGLVASHGSRRIALGNGQLMTRYGVPIGPGDRAEFAQIAQSGATPSFLALDRKIIAVLGFRDPIRPEARGALAALREKGIKLVLASGDDAAVANDVAERLGIGEVCAQLMPAGKIGVVTHFQQEGKTVCMIGDGTPDAPALAAADIGIAIGAGPDTAAEAGDIVLARGDLYDVVRAMALGNLTIAKIRQNRFLAGLYNLIAIPIAAGILYPLIRIPLNPAVGGLAMGLAGAAIVHNSLLLKISGRLRLLAIRPKLETPPSAGAELPATPSPEPPAPPPEDSDSTAGGPPAAAKSK